jgi:hypothetical protein
MTNPPQCRAARRLRRGGHRPPPQPVTPWWHQPAVIIPIIISMIAVLFTGATYWDQHQADQAAAAAADRSDASLVSFWTNTQGPTIVTIQNLSTVPIQSVMFEFAFDVFGKSRQTSYLNIPIDGVLPPCTQAEFNTASWYPLQQDPVTLPLALYFTSANGQVWQLSYYGALAPGTYPYDVTVQATYAFANVHSVGGCG